MKILRRWLLACFLLFLAIDIASAQARVHVRAYTRKDGTHVRTHDRRASGTAATSSVSPSNTSYPRTPSSSTGSTSSNFTPATDPGLSEIEPAPISEPEPKSISTRNRSQTSSRRHSNVRRAPAPHDWSRNEVPRPSSVTRRDSHGRIQRSDWAKRIFMRMTGYPHGRPGYVVDHIVPLKRGGDDMPCNMQWQTIAEAKAKDKWE